MQDPRASAVVAGWLRRGVMWAVLGVAPVPAGADWIDEVGFTELAAELGDEMPDGSGLGVTQVEAANSGGNYLPEAGVSPVAGGGLFAGKTFTDGTVEAGLRSTGQSVHASAVGAFIYGVGSSLAPGVTDVRVVRAASFTARGFLNPGFQDRPPAVEGGVVQNHSWISSDESGEEATDLLRRLDFAIDRDGFVACVGLNNGAGPVPPLLASAFGVISVGRSDGLHSGGGTPEGVDVPGRCKPEIVAPGGATSWTTGMVSSAAALLIGSPQGGGRWPETTKAVLLAGASKEPFPGWSNSTDCPLDATFGAGQLDVARSYRLLAGGPQSPGAAAEVAVTGWDEGAPLGAGEVRRYFFSVAPGTTGGPFSAVLAWNRTVTDGDPGPGFRGEAAHHDLALELRESSGFVPGAAVAVSDSAVDNVEHIFERELPAGEYVLSVSGDAGRRYALAWGATVSPMPSVLVADLGVREDGGGAVSVSLSAPGGQDVRFGYSVVGGTAAAGVDYFGVAGEVTVPAGEGGVALPLQVVPDGVFEADETIEIALSGVEGAFLPESSFTVTLLNDDPVPSVVVEALEGRVPEAGGRARFRLSLSNPSYLPVTGAVSTAAGGIGAAEAEAGVDFGGLSGLGFEIAPGGLVAEVPVVVIDDPEPEANEAFSLGIDGVVNAVVGPGAAAGVLVVDDDFESVLQSTRLELEADGMFSLRWEAVAGRFYAVLESADLQGWVPVAGAGDVVGTGGAVEVPLGAVSAGRRRYYQVVDVTNVAAP